MKARISASSNWSSSTLLCGILLVGVWAAGPAAAQWQWRSADGSITASDRPPPRDIPDKDILKRPRPETRRTPPPGAAASAPVAAPASAPTTALEREVQARKRIADQEQVAKAKADEERQSAARTSNCRNARSALASLESGVRVTRTNEKGEREFLDDSARAEETRRARDTIAQDCR
jgi:hypothetical protein